MLRLWPALTGLLIFLGLGAAVHAGVTQHWDAGVVSRCVAHQTPGQKTLLQGISLLGSGWMLTLAVLGSVAAWTRPSLRPDALRLLVAIGGGEALVNSLKWLWHRPRPSPVYASLGYSFPSGHSFFSLTVYSLLAVFLTRGQRRGWPWLCALLLALAIGISRVAVGVHYPTDVLGGFALALPWLWVCRTLPEREAVP